MKAKNVLIGASLFLMGAISGATPAKSARVLNDVEEANYLTLGYKIELIRAYNCYYIATEQLLDDLEARYNWVDGEDPQQYYEARDTLTKVISKEDSPF